MILSRTTLTHGVALVASLAFLLVPLDRARPRAVWAKAVIVAVGSLGVLVSGAELLFHTRWGNSSRELLAWFRATKGFLCGFALGLIAALILSGQLAGVQRRSQGLVQAGN